MFQRIKRNPEFEEAALQTVFFSDGEYEGKPCRVSGANYLAFLNMRGADVTSEIEKLHQLIEDVPRAKLEEDLISLLRSVNWRFHNIACVFIALGFRSEGVFIALWDRIAQGSWTSPQLVAAASFTDGDFKNKAMCLVRNENTYFKSIISLAAVLEQEHGVSLETGYESANYTTGRSPR